MTLSPAELEDIKTRAARELADRILHSVDIDELNTLEISTAASFLGIPVDRAAKLLPVVEVGPRSRRVTIKAYKAFLSANTLTKARA